MSSFCNHTFLNVPKFKNRGHSLQERFCDCDTIFPRNRQFYILYSTCIRKFYNPLMSINQSIKILKYNFEPFQWEDKLFSLPSCEVGNRSETEPRPPCCWGGWRGRGRESRGSSNARSRRCSCTGGRRTPKSPPRDHRCRGRRQTRAGCLGLDYQLSLTRGLKQLNATIYKKNLFFVNIYFIVQCYHITEAGR